MKSPHQQRVEEFMRLAGQPVPPSPTHPDPKVAALRASLILEEALELVEALGCKVYDQANEHYISRAFLRCHSVTPANLVQVAAESADVSVVNTGTLSALGIQDEPVQEAVDRANLRKFGPGGYRREDGKWMKPADFVPADMAAVLREQGYGSNS